MIAILTTIFAHAAFAAKHLGLLILGINWASVCVHHDFIMVPRWIIVITIIASIAQLAVSTIHELCLLGSRFHSFDSQVCIVVNLAVTYILTLKLTIHILRLFDELLLGSVHGRIKRTLTVLHRRVPTFLVPHLLSGIILLLVEDDIVLFAVRDRLVAVCSKHLL